MITEDSNILFTGKSLVEFRNCILSVGDKVVKKNREPFENELDICVIRGFTAMRIANKIRDYYSLGVVLEGCAKPVDMRILRIVELCDSKASGGMT